MWSWQHILFFEIHMFTSGSTGNRHKKAHAATYIPSSSGMRGATFLNQNVVFFFVSMLFAQLQFCQMTTNKTHYILEHLHSLVPFCTLNVCAPPAGVWYVCVCVSVLNNGDFRATERHVASVYPCWYVGSEIWPPFRFRSHPLSLSLLPVQYAKEA